MMEKNSVQLSGTMLLQQWPQMPEIQFFFYPIFFHGTILQQGTIEVKGWLSGQALFQCY
jgi:hypothetical protein